MAGAELGEHGLVVTGSLGGLGGLGGLGRIGGSRMLQPSVTAVGARNLGLISRCGVLLGVAGDATHVELESKGINLTPELLDDSPQPAGLLRLVSEQQYRFRFRLDRGGQLALQHSLVVFRFSPQLLGRRFGVVHGSGAVNKPRLQFDDVALELGVAGLQLVKSSSHCIRLPTWCCL